jgi:CD2 antigen cytoplasmic tail-binding protein 2
MKKAAAAHEKREAELRQQRREEDSILTADLFKALILRLERGETALEALARLGKSQVKPKKVPKWKMKKQQASSEAMDVDAAEDEKQIKIKEAINEVTEAADRLLKRDYPEIYDTEREMLMREYRNETGEAWVDAPRKEDDEESEEDTNGNASAQMWEFRWTDGRDGGTKQGPFDGPTMKAWQDAGYFGEGVEFRQAGQDAGWTRIASFV